MERLPGRPYRHGPVGTARAFPKLANTVPPTGPWSQEISPMGSNDFRSTKRNIHWAAIHYPDGPGVVVESNGHQHVRAMVQSDRTSVHVSDWYGGTEQRLLGMDAQLRRRQADPQGRQPDVQRETANIAAIRSSGESDRECGCPLGRRTTRIDWLSMVMLPHHTPADSRFRYAKA